MLTRVADALLAAGQTGVTVDDIAERTGVPAALVRSTLAHGTFVEQRVTIVPGTVSKTPRDGKLHLARFKLGDPTDLLLAG